MDFFLLFLAFNFIVEICSLSRRLKMNDDNPLHDDDFEPSGERQREPWEEEEEDERRLNGDLPANCQFPDRFRSLVSQSRVRSSVHFADANIEARIDAKLDSKFDGFLAKVREAVGSSSSNASPAEGALSGQMENLVFTQKELRCQQLAASIKTDGGKYQFLALKTKIKGAEKIVKSSMGKSVPMSASQTIELSQ